MSISLFNFNAVAPCSDAIVATGPVTQGHCVTYAGDTAGAGLAVAGIAEYDGAIGDEVTLTVGALQLPAIAGAAITVGQPLASDATGRLVPALTGNYVVGRAVKPATGADTVVIVRLTHEGLSTIV